MAELCSALLRQIYRPNYLLCSSCHNWVPADRVLEHLAAECQA